MKCIQVPESIKILVRDNDFLAKLYAKAYMPLLCRYVGLADKKYINKTGFKYLPPAPLRYRVHGRPEIDSFLDIGMKNASEIENSLTSVGADLRSNLKVLDFGCGCGRTLIWFSEKKSYFHGTDIDFEAVSWCKRNLKFAEFNVNNPLPPLGYEDNFFDVIYCVSVFTHLNLDRRDLWLKELGRILKNRGTLIISLHGKEAWKDLPAEDIKELQDNGFIFRFREKGPFPEWYQTSYETDQYARTSFGRFFKVLKYTEKGFNDYQDLILLQK